MTFDEIRNEIGATRGEYDMDAAQASILSILSELTTAVEALSVRVQEIALDQVTAEVTVDETERRMEAVVDAAVAWHQSDDDWQETADTLGTAIDHLLELRAAPECFCGTQLEAGLCPNGHDPVKEGQS